MITERALETFTRAYIECAMWSSTDENDKPFDESDAELSAEAQQQMRDDCKDFIETAEPLLLQSRLTWESAGHDFWLTRNRHGAGFWDRGLGRIGQELTDLAHPYGECYLYTGDDGQIYCQ